MLHCITLLSCSTSPTSMSYSYSAHCLIELPALPRPQDVLRTVPERNPAGRLEDLSGEGWAGWLMGNGWRVAWLGSSARAWLQSAQAGLALKMLSTPYSCHPTSTLAHQLPSHPHPCPPAAIPPLHSPLQCTSASSVCCTWPTSTAWSSARCRSSTACTSQTCPRTSSSTSEGWPVRQRPPWQQP